MNPNRIFPLAYLLLSSLMCFSQDNKPAVKSAHSSQPEAGEILLKQLPRDSVLSVKGVTAKNDTVNLDQVIAVRLRTTHDIREFTFLIVNGLVVHAERINFSDIDNIVFFKLDDSVKHNVETFLDRTSSGRNVIALGISVGRYEAKEKKIYAAAGEKQIVLRIKPQVNTAYGWVAVFIVLLLTIVGLRNHILKDDNNLYYSLARAQLFYWTLLFVFCYLFIWFQTGSLPDVTPTALVILGISAATTAAGKVVENQSKLKVEIDPHAKSEGFFMDILSDGSSINIHRFQNIVFSVVFGIIFVQRSVSAHAMPSFDENVLLLMGLSSGTYAGLKITEPLKEQSQVAPVTGTDKDVVQADKNTAQAVG